MVTAFVTAISLVAIVFMGCFYVGLCRDAPVKEKHGQTVVQILAISDEPNVGFARVIAMPRERKSQSILPSASHLALLEATSETPINADCTGREFNSPYFAKPGKAE